MNEGENLYMDALQDEVKRLTAERDRLEVTLAEVSALMNTALEGKSRMTLDAFRYRFLRDGQWGRAVTPKVYAALMHMKGDLDASIDAALQEKRDE